MKSRSWREALRRSPIAALLALGALVVSATIAAGSLLAPSTLVPIPPEALQSHGGRAWSVALAPLIAAADIRFPFEPYPTDSNAHPAVSPHRLLEDGEPLAPAHAVHAEIASLGGGRHSFWGDMLVLSVPDGGDPRVDGRSRSVQVVGRVAPWLSIVAMLLPIAPMVWLVRHVRGRTLARVATTIALAAPAAIVVVAWLAPRASAASDRVPPVLIAAALLGALAAGVASNRRTGCAGRLAARLHRVGLVAAGDATRRAAAAWMIAVLLLGLLRAWSPLAPPRHAWPGVGTFSLLQGRFLTSDALYGWVASQWLRWHGELPYFGARRPLLPTLLACESALVDGRPQGLAICNTILMAISIAFAARAAGRTLGTWVGVATAAVLIGYAQHFVALPMTETLGITLGAVGTALLLEGARSGRLIALASGSFGLALGLAARPGALLILPALLVAVAWNARRSVRRGAVAVGACAAAMAGAFCVNGAVLALTTDGRGAANSNVPYVLLGLASGGDWSDGIRFCIAEQPDGTEEEHAALAMTEALRRVRADPAVLVGSLGRNMRAFLGAWGTGISAHFGDRASLRPWLAHATWGGLGVVGVVVLWRRQPRAGAIVAMGALGVLASMPFIWRDGGWRALAPTLPLLAVAATSWLAWPRLATRAPGARGGASTAPMLLLAALTAAIVGTAIFAAMRRDGSGPPHLDATVRRYLEGDGASPGSVRSIVVPNLRSLPSAVIGPGRRFEWTGPAHIARRDLERDMAALGVSTETWRALAEVNDASPILVQYVRIDADGGMPSGVFIAPAALLGERRGPVACRVEHIGFSAWIGSIGRLVEFDDAPGR